MVKKKTVGKYLVILLLFILFFRIYQYITMGEVGHAALKGIVRSDIRWELGHIEEYTEGKTLDISIYNRYGIAMTKYYAQFYRTVVEELLDSPKSKYRDYQIVIRICWDEYCFRIIRRENGHLLIDSTDIMVSLRGIAKYFPEAVSVSIGQGTGYCSIDEIRGFDDLRVFDCGKGITKEEEETILSIFPDCNILCPVEENKKD